MFSHTLDISFSECVRNISLNHNFKYVITLMKKLWFRVFPKDEEFYHHANILYLEKVIDFVNPEMIVFFLYSPDKELVELCRKRDIPYCYALYDTYLKRPDTKIDTDIEAYVIKNAIHYFVPSFFYDDYQSFYGYPQIKKYDLPLLIPKESVIKATDEEAPNFKFSYFGQLQSFRNVQEISGIFRELNQELHVFSWNHIEDEAIKMHEPLKGDKLLKAVAHSDFLVVFDNNMPYRNYLPSKVFLYVPFCKPIVVFGRNEKSAVRNFLKDYPYWYYHMISEPLEGLIEFTGSNIIDGFDDSIYEQYTQYLPENAMKKIHDDVIETLIRDNACLSSLISR